MQLRSRGRRQDDFILTVDVPVTTLCPCSKQISARGAHNQRGLVKVRVRFDGLVWLEEVIELVEQSASCDLYPILKRLDEKYVTEKAYDNPRFVEDTGARGHPSSCARIRGCAGSRCVENFESIHAPQRLRLRRRVGRAPVIRI